MCVWWSLYDGMYAEGSDYGKGPSLFLKDKCSKEWPVLYKTAHCSLWRLKDCESTGWAKWFGVADQHRASQREKVSKSCSIAFHHDPSY
jgi:hypothetical protein